MNEIKRCPKCGTGFTLADLLFNCDIDPVGITFENDNPRFNCFYFTHDVDHCGTTFAVPINDVKAALGSPPQDQNLALTDGCERHCLNLEDHEICGQPCCWAPFRLLLGTMLASRGKNVPAPTPAEEH